MNSCVTRGPCPALPCRRTLFARTIRCLSSLQWLVVVAVAALISSIILLGVAYVLVGQGSGQLVL